MTYLKVKPKDLKKHGKKIKGVLYLNEGVYTTITPNVQIEEIVINNLNKS